MAPPPLALQSSTAVMVALQKKQSLLFIRCWLMQALQGEGEGRVPLPRPRPPPAQGRGAVHLLAGLVATGLEHGRDGVRVADGAEVLLAGGLREHRARWAQASVQPRLRRRLARGPLTREAAAAWADAAVRCASICSTWASSSLLM